MTLFKPTIILNRLLILRKNLSVYDEKFHHGLNVIRGDNGSGKSTILDCIVYSLGGNITAWSNEARSCDFVIGEFSINGKTLTFKRAIETNSFPPIDIFEGSYEETFKSPDGWLRYGPRRTNERDSYSQIIFRLLELPEQKSEQQNSNVTIHDVLRLVYEDQATSSEKIFRDDRFDPEDKRDAIAQLLLGLDDFEVLELKRKLKEKEIEFRDYKTRLSQIFEILGSADANITLKNINAEIEQYKNEKEKIQRQIATLSDSTEEYKTKEAATRKELEGLKSEILKSRKYLSAKKAEQDRLIFDIEDSEEFIDSINTRLKALFASEEVRRTLGGLEFVYCPACLQLIKNTDDANNCHLCKSPVAPGSENAGYLRMENELKFQLRESESLLEEKEKRLETIKIDLKQVGESLTKLERQFATYENTVNPIEAQLKNLLTQIGYFERAIEGAHEKERLAKTIDDLSNRKADANAEITRLTTDIELLEKLKQSKRAKIYTTISNNTLKLIREDVGNEFNETQHVAFNFSKNHVGVDNKTKLAASSETYLKNCFLFSVFQTSLQMQEVRFPRLIILDNIEDNGLEARRIQQLHKNLLEHSIQFKDVVHQIILTASTSTISAELDASNYCVGNHYYDEDGKRSLNFQTTQNVSVKPAN